MTTAHGYRDASNTLQHGPMSHPFSTPSDDPSSRRITKAITGTGPWCRRPRRPSHPQRWTTPNDNRTANTCRITKAITGTGLTDCTYHYYLSGQSVIEELGRHPHNLLK